MTLILSGTDGVSDIDGTAATPAIRGTDANTGIFFPAADTIAFAEGGVESMRINSSGNVGIGTTNPTSKLTVVGTLETSAFQVSLSSNQTTIDSYNYNMLLSSVFTGGIGGNIIFNTGVTTVSERMRIDSSGNVKLSTAGTSILNSSGNKILNQTGSVLQVVQGTIASGTTTTSTSFVDTGLTVSITPSSSSSKVMIIACCVNILNDGSNKIEFQLLRGASVLQLSAWGANVRTDGSITFSYLDSPATTSSTTYKVQFRTQNAATTAYISNSNYTSSIVAMEIAA